MSKSNILLEMELGITGGEEDGVDNTDVDSSEDLYSKPEEVHGRCTRRSRRSPNGMFSVAAAFGNVHGVYAPGNVKLTPQILHNAQKYIKEKEGLDVDKPVSSSSTAARAARRARTSARRSRRVHQDEHRHRHPVVHLGRRARATSR